MRLPYFIREHKTGKCSNTEKTAKTKSQGMGKIFRFRQGVVLIGTTVGY